MSRLKNVRMLVYYRIFKNLALLRVVADVKNPFSKQSISLACAALGINARVSTHCKCNPPHSVKCLGAGTSP